MPVLTKLRGNCVDLKSQDMYNQLPVCLSCRASLTLSDFNILGHIGDGSLATVVLAERKAPNNFEKYAIKIVNKHVVMRNKMVDYVKNERYSLGFFMPKPVFTG
jgi:hypothetical protein